VKLLATAIPGCWIIEHQQIRDDRGSLTKVFQSSVLEAVGVTSGLREIFWTESGSGVLRGMHFQKPPFEQGKLVFVASGEILDVALDLRGPRRTPPNVVSLTLNAAEGRALWMPPGVAHGFLVTTSAAIVGYAVTSEYSSAHDQGVRWDSFGFEWPTADPLISARDSQFPRFSSFVSPFPEEP